MDMARIKGHSPNNPLSTGSGPDRGRGGALGNNRPASSAADRSSGLLRFGTDPLHASYGDNGWPNTNISRPYYSSYYGRGNCGYRYRAPCYPRSCYSYNGYYPWYGWGYGYGYGLGVSYGLGYSYPSVYYAEPYVSTVYSEPTYVPQYSDTEYVTPPDEPATAMYGSPPVDQAGSVQPTVPNTQLPTISNTQPQEGVDNYQSLAGDESHRAVVTKGNEAFAAGRYDDARGLYARAVMSDERDGYAKVLYAWANFALGNYEVAAAALRRGLLTTPDLVDYPLDLRTLYPDLEILDRQRDDLKRFIAGNPGHREAQFVWGYLLYSTGEAGPAESVFNSLESADKNDTLMSLLGDAAARNARGKTTPSVRQP